MEVISLIKSGDFHTALPLLENMTSDQLSELTLPDKCTPLHYACQHGRVDVAQQLITHCKYSIESKDRNGRTPLHSAAQYGQVSTLKYLLHNLFINEESSLSLKSDSTLAHTLAFMFQLKLLDRHKDIVGNTPLHTACVHGQLDIVQLLTREIGCDPNDSNSEGLSCLHLAAQHGHLPLVRYLIEEVGSDVTLKDEHRRSPTYLAAGGGHLDILKYLIGEKGADPHFTTSKERNTAKFSRKWKMAPGRSLVHTASREGHLHVVRYLVEQHGCDPSQKDAKGVTPLHLPCQQGHMDIVTYLITEGNCDPNGLIYDGRSCLHIASQKGHLEVVKYLVETHGCNPLCTNKNSSTPLHWAAANGRLEVLSYFTTTLNCSILIRDSYNNTPLHSAALQGHLKVIKFIIEDMKCDPDSKGRFERTPLLHASQNGHLEVVKYLVETHGCNPLCTDKDNITPLHLAAANGQLEVLSYFAITHNCNLNIEDSFHHTPLFYSTLFAFDDHEVESYLLRATTNQPVIEIDVISPSLNIFVIGNSGSGKSTLVKSLSSESSILGRLVTVKDVKPLTAGIVTSEIKSQVFGSINIYDFAGHEEYYASHEMIIQQSSRPLVLLTVDISLPHQIIEKQLLYWLSVLSNGRTCHVVIIGSHFDQANSTNNELPQNVVSLIRTESSILYHGFIQCDCRYTTSQSLNQLRVKLNSICRLIQHVIAVKESNNSNKLCASLMYYLKHNIPEKSTVTVRGVMKHIQKLRKDFIKPHVQHLLIKTCKSLSSSGNLLFIVCDENPEESLLVLNNNIILEKVHGCLTVIKKEIPNEFGIVNENQLIKILSESLEDVIEPEQAIKYLIFSQFCTKILSGQLILPSTTKHEGSYYFFPNLVSDSGLPSDILPPQDHKHTHFYTWCLKCSNIQQFFTPRYLHTLFIQLIKFERSKPSSECKVWKNGILLVHNNGTRSIIEVTDQTTRVSLAIQCIEGHELQLVKQRSQLISIIKSLVHKICPRVKVDEFLHLSQNAYPPNPIVIPIAKVAFSLINGHTEIAYNDGDTLRHALVKDLLYYDSFGVINLKPILQDIITHRIFDNVVPLATMTGIHSAVETCRELQERFEDEAGQCRRDMTYSQLYRELIKYSIFTDGNLFVSQ